MRRLALLLLSLTFVACAAHEKAGDRAAAVGDWKTAEREYAQALRGDPDSPEKRAKYQSARSAAVASSTAKAQACSVSQDWECAFAEADYALRLDEGNATIAALRADAARNVGMLRVSRAEDAGRAGDFRGAFGLLGSARAVTNDPGVAAAAKRAEPAIVRGAVTEAYRLRDALQYPQALELLGLAVAVDPSLRPAVAQVRAEYERWLDAEYERAAQEGDALLAAGRWPEAKARYDAALGFRKGGRAEALARYAGDMISGEQAVAARDFARAQAAYEDAIRLGLDRDGAAAEALDRVRIRPVAIRVRSVLVKPFRPDGEPWAGPRGRGFDRVVGLLAASALDGGRASRTAIDVYDALPTENRPNLFVIADLPDGRRIATAPRPTLHARLDASFVVSTNAYDERTVTFHVAHREGAGFVELGAVQVRIADLVENGDATLADGSIVQLRLDLDATRLPDGSFVGFQPVPDATNVAVAWSVPGPSTRAFRLVGIDAAVQPTDYVNEGAADGPPDLYVEIEQRGAIVYRSPVLADRATGSWTPGAAYLFVTPDEQVTVRLWDDDGADAADAVVALAVQGRALDAGAVELRSPRGSQLRVRVEPRNDGPGTRGPVARR
jgi:tetratricopeptide (TPR) repeat protein